MVTSIQSSIFCVTSSFYSWPCYVNFWYSKVSCVNLFESLGRINNIVVCYSTDLCRWSKKVRFFFFFFWLNLDSLCIAVSAILRNLFWQHTLKLLCLSLVVLFQYYFTTDYIITNSRVILCEWNLVNAVNEHMLSSNFAIWLYIRRLETFIRAEFKFWWC